MDGFKRPTKPQQPQEPLLSQSAPPANKYDELPEITPMDNEESRAPHRLSRKMAIILSTIVVGVVVLVAGALWLNSQLVAVNKDDTSPQKIEIKEGTAFSYVASRLQERGLIRSSVAFDMYARISGKRNAIQSGTCTLNPSETAKEILTKLTSGCHDFKSITFYPGATIEKPLYKPKGSTLDQTLYVKNMLSSAGFSDSQIAAALGKTYSGPLFADKPAGTTLEGYVFGETYYVDTDATAEKVLQTAFDQMYKVIQRNDLVAGFKAQQLNLYQGITLASVVQSELDCEDKSTPDRKERCYQYQRTIAQIFLKRLREGISLGSDVTFIYAANMQKVNPTVDIDSPYNTRIKPGLPPGPISSPGELALKAVANPTDTDYLFFIAGDDGLIYFAKTDAEHQKNIKDHCQIGCGEL
jgi:UPF0755 protein